MTFLDRILFHRTAREAAPPALAAPDRVAAVRNEVVARLSALRQRFLARQRRERERQRQLEEERRRREAEAAARPAPPPSAGSGPRYSIGGSRYSLRADISSAIDVIDPRAFSRHLTWAVRDVYGGNPVAFYTAAGISRSAYSKIISHPDRHPAKDTVLAMAAALQMDLPAAEHFLRLAGYALSDSIPADIVWRACFLRAIHHLPQIRELLAEFAPTNPANPAPSASKP